MADETLEFLLKLQADVEGGLKMVRALGTTEESLASVAAATGKTEKATEHAGRAHGKHAKDAEHLEGALHRLVHAGMDPFIERAKQIAEFEFIRRGVDAILEAPLELMHVVRELGEAIVEATGKAEESRIVFNSLFGGEEAEQLIEYSDKLGDKTGVLGKQWREIELTLGNAGFRMDDMRRAAAAVADLGALSGHGAAGAEEAADMLARLQNRGELSPRMLMQFKISEKDFWTELNARTGVGIETLKKNMAKGKVDIDAIKESIYTLITAKTHRDLGGLGADVGEDLQSKIARLKNLPERYFEKFATSPGLESGKSKLDEVLEAFDPDSPRGARIFGSLERAVLSVVDSVAKIDFEHVASVVETEILPDIEAIVKTIANVDWVGGAGMLVDVLKVIGQTVDGIVVAYKALGWLNDKLTVHFGGQNTSNAAQGDGTGFFQRAGRELARPGTDVLKDVWHSYTGLVDKVMGDGGKSAGAAMGAGVTSGLEGGHPAVRAATAAVGYQSMDAFQSTLGIQSPSTVFEGYGEMAAAGYSRGMTSSAPAVRAATETMAVAPSGRGGTTTMDVGGVKIDIHVHGEGEGSADEVAQRLDEILPEKIAQLFERARRMRGA